MDFDKIALTLCEAHTLKLSSKKLVKKSKCNRLLRLKLVCEIKEQPIPGGMPIGIGLCKISEKGIDYLLYRKDFNRTRFTLPIIVSIITTIIMNVGLWLLPRLLRLIQQWI